MPFLAARVHHVPGVQDQVRLQALQQRGHRQLILPPAAAVAYHGEGEAGVLAFGGGAKAGHLRNPIGLCHLVVVRRSGAEAGEHNHVAPSDTSINPFSPEPRGFPVLHDTHAWLLAHPGDHRRGRRDVLHVRAPRGCPRFLSGVDKLGACGCEGRLHAQLSDPKCRP